MLTAANANSETLLSSHLTIILKLISTLRKQHSQVTLLLSSQTHRTITSQALFYFFSDLSGYRLEVYFYCTLLFDELMNLISIWLYFVFDEFMNLISIWLYYVFDELKQKELYFLFVSNIVVLCICI